MTGKGEYELPFRRSYIIAVFCWQVAIIAVKVGTSAGRGDRAPGVKAGRTGRRARGNRAREAGRTGRRPGGPGGAGRTGREVFTIRLGAAAAGYRSRAIGSAGRMITPGLG